MQFVLKNLICYLQTELKLFYTSFTKTFLFGRFFKEIVSLESVKMSFCKMQERIYKKRFIAGFSAATGTLAT